VFHLGKRREALVALSSWHYRVRLTLVQNVLFKRLFAERVTENASGFRAVKIIKHPSSTRTVFRQNVQNERFRKNANDELRVIFPKQFLGATQPREMFRYDPETRDGGTPSLPCSFGFSSDGFTVLGETVRRYPLSGSETRLKGSPRRHFGT